MPIMATTATTGSMLLQPLGNAINLPIDQVNFVACQLFALLAAIWFRIYLHPSKTSTFIRHVVATFLGFYLALFCFGWYALHFIIQSGISYYIMILAGPESMHRYCFVFALGYLTLCQISRVYIFDYGQYSADFSGPLMIITQKITSLAFEIHDGMTKKHEQLTPSQRHYAIRRMPSLLEYLSYNCNFMGILAGPLCSYKDYVTFIEGRAYHLKHVEANGGDKKYEQAEPSPDMAVVQKLTVCTISLFVYLTVTKLFPVDRNIDDSYKAKTSLPLQLVYLYISLMAARPKYYFAWTLADAINNAAGFGFNGYDKNGHAQWDLISNLRILKIEFATSFKMFIDNWNIQTALWLKRVCYERAFVHPTAETFLLSAVWHGVYPGYYLTFFTGVFMTLAARKIRNNVRHYFLDSTRVKLLYDIVTWIATQLAISYTVVPFVLLSVEPSLKFYRSWFYFLHIICMLLILLLPTKVRPKVMEQQKANIPSDEPQKLEEKQNWSQNSHSTNWNQSQKTL